MLTDDKTLHNPHPKETKPPYIIQSQIIVAKWTVCFTTSQLLAEFLCWILRIQAINCLTAVRKARLFRQN